MNHQKREKPSSWYPFTLWQPFPFDLAGKKSKQDEHSFSLDFYRVTYLQRGFQRGCQQDAASRSESI